MLRTTSIWILAAYPITVAAFGALAMVVPIEAGPLALVSILWVHLALVGLLLLPVAIVVKKPAILRLGLLGLVVVLALRVGGEWLSLPATGGADPVGRDLKVVTWNVHAGSDPDAVVAVLHDHPADIVGLQEVDLELGLALEADPGLTTRYPYRTIDSQVGVTGIALLSRWPLVKDSAGLDPSREVATLSIDGQTLDVINAHPLHALMTLGARGIPIDYDPAQRNDQLGFLRGLIDDRLANGTPVLVMGDFNTAPTEPAFARLIDGLHDAHAEVGIGPGWTYGSRFVDFGFGLLRLDLVLGSPEVVPIDVGEDCVHPSDHCLVHATVRIGGANTR